MIASWFKCALLTIGISAVAYGEVGSTRAYWATQAVDAGDGGVVSPTIAPAGYKTFDLVFDSPDQWFVAGWLRVQVSDGGIAGATAQPEPSATDASSGQASDGNGDKPAELYREIIWSPPGANLGSPEDNPRTIYRVTVVVPPGEHVTVTTRLVVGVLPNTCGSVCVLELPIPPLVVQADDYVGVDWPEPDGGENAPVVVDPMPLEDAGEVPPAAVQQVMSLVTEADGAAETPLPGYYVEVTISGGDSAVLPAREEPGGRVAPDAAAVDPLPAVGLCGAGVVGVLPVLFVGLAALRPRRRFVRRESSGVGR